MNKPDEAPSTRLAFVLIVSLFFLWGVANNLNDILIPQFKKAFTLSDLQSGLVQSAFYLGYFLIALPASAYMQRFGYKAAVVAGLLLYGAGALLFYPAGAMRSYGLFLAALFVIASGLAFLETSANPLVTLLGDPATATRRLNLAQAFNPLGAISGVLIGRTFILSGHEPSAAQLAAMPPAARALFYATESRAAEAPYLVLAVLVLGCAALVAIARFPAVALRPIAAETRVNDLPGPPLLRRPRFVAGVFAQFCYVGAQVGLWSYTIRYAQAEVPGIGEKTAAADLMIALVLFMIGRFVGTALMARLRPGLLMAACATMACLLTLVAALMGGSSGFYAMIGASLFMSIMFPTIFALAVADLGDRLKTGSAIVIMAIVGGAAFTAIMGYVSDISAIRTALLVPAGCFVVVGLFGLFADVSNPERRAEIMGEAR